MQFYLNAVKKLHGSFGIVVSQYRQASSNSIVKQPNPAIIRVHQINLAAPVSLTT
jgi:hypothetical protein